VIAAADNADEGRSAKRRKGFVLVYRSLIDSPIFDDAGLFRLFVYLLLRAAHKPRWVTIRTGRGTKQVLVDVGQVLLGLPSLASKMRTPKTTLRRWLSRLKADRQIEVKADTHYTIVTLCHWASYQTPSKKNGQANGAASGAPTGQATGHPTGHIQSIGNKSLGKKERAAAAPKPASPKSTKVTSTEAVEAIPADLRTPVLKQPLVDWLEYKSERRESFTPTGLRSFFSRTRNLVTEHGEKLVAAAIEKAMANGWKSYDQESSLPKVAAPKPAASTYVGPGDPEWKTWRGG